MGRLPYRTFLPFNVLGGLTWAPTFVVLGYAAGGSYNRVEKVAGRASLLLVVAVVVVGGLALAARWVARYPDRVEDVARRKLDLPAVRRLRARHGRLFDVLADRFRPAGAFGLSLTAGLVGVGLFGWGFGELLDSVLDRQGLAGVDLPVLSFLAAHRSPWLTTVMRIVTTIGSPTALAITAAVVAGAVTWRRRSAAPLLLAAAVVVGVELLETSLKAVVGRARPPLEWAVPGVTAHGYAFPSGHASQPAAIYGVLAFLLAGLVRGWSGKVAIWTGTLLARSACPGSRRALAHRRARRLGARRRLADRRPDRRHHLDPGRAGAAAGQRQARHAWPGAFERAGAGGGPRDAGRFQWVGERRAMTRLTFGGVVRADGGGDDGDGGFVWWELAQHVPVQLWLLAAGLLLVLVAVLLGLRHAWRRSRRMGRCAPRGLPRGLLALQRTRFPPDPRGTPRRCVGSWPARWPTPAPPWRPRRPRTRRTARRGRRARRRRRDRRAAAAVQREPDRPSRPPRSLSPARAPRRFCLRAGPPRTRRRPAMSRPAVPIRRKDDVTGLAASARRRPGRPRRRAGRHPRLARAASRPGAARWTAAALWDGCTTAGTRGAPDSAGSQPGGCRAGAGGAAGAAARPGRSAA